MKKIFIISIAIFGLGIVSCQKQEIAPNSGEVTLPEWEESARIGDNDNDDDGRGTVGGITDPFDENDDTDANDGARYGDGDNPGSDDGTIGGITDPFDENDEPNDTSDPDDGDDNTSGRNKG